MTVPSFPNNPSNGQTYTENGITYTWVENGSEEGYWAASGESITLQSVTTAGNTTTLDVTTGDLTTTGFVSVTGDDGFLNVNRTNPAASTTNVAVFQADGTTGALIRADGSGNFTGAVTCGTATTESSADSVLATKGYVDSIAGGGGSPAGSIIMFGGATAPADWLICDGSAVSRTTQANLFAAIGTAFGAGDGSTTFNLPDMRGQFARGVNTTGSGIDPSRTLGSTQAEETNLDDLSGALQILYGNSAGSTTTAFGRSLYQFVNPWTSATALRFSSSGSGGDETRPTNVALNFIIRT